PVATGVTGNGYLDTGLTDGDAYYYTVTAVNGVGEGTPSNEVSATPQAASSSVPATPTGLSAVTAKGKGIQLTWDASSDPSVTSYEVYRSTTATGTFDAIATTTSPSYKDTSTSRGTTYFYYVTAVNAAGQSAPSATRSAKSK
ncbi:MAG: fibronectin type III domain-containing protein, partial [Gaiellaceae bacterium]